MAKNQSRSRILITVVLLSREQRRNNNLVQVHRAQGLVVSGDPSRGKVEAKGRRKKNFKCFKCGDWDM